MKIKTEHYNKLKTAIDLVLNGYPDIVSDYEAGLFSRSDKVKDLQKRFCFDLLFGTGLSSWVSKELYSYLDDTHIYSALKSMTPKLVRGY